jgi:trehalose 6-phosphate phosphatase
MEHLFQFWQAFTAECRAALHILFLSDYDGTLTPIVSRPEDALLSPQVRDKLSTLARKPTVSVGIITGRSLSEIKSMVAIEGIYYSGNHGLEIEGPGLSYVSPIAETARTTMKDLARVFTGELAGIDGFIIQEKGLSLSVHYRLVKVEEESIVAETFRRVTAPLLDKGKIKVFAGKKVWEVKPPIDWHKGKAIEAINREIKALLKLESLLTIYLGDDFTDEDAFRVLHRPEGWSIFVGGENPSSAAEYFLNSPAEVEELLARLIELK